MVFVISCLGTWRIDASFLSLFHLSRNPLSGYSGISTQEGYVVGIAQKHCKPSKYPHLLGKSLWVRYTKVLLNLGRVQERISLGNWGGHSKYLSTLGKKESHSACSGQGTSLERTEKTLRSHYWLIYSLTAERSEGWGRIANGLAKC